MPAPPSAAAAAIGSDDSDSFQWASRRATLAQGVGATARPLAASALPNSGRSGCAAPFQVCDRPVSHKASAGEPGFRADRRYGVVSPSVADVHVSPFHEPPVPKVVYPFFKVTVPWWALSEATVAVKVTAAPNVDGFRDEASPVDSPPVPRVCVSACAALPGGEVGASSVGRCYGVSPSRQGRGLKRRGAIAERARAQGGEPVFKELRGACPLPR